MMSDQWLEFDRYGYHVIAVLRGDCWNVDMLYPGEKQPGASLSDMANLDMYLQEQAGRSTITYVVSVRPMTAHEREKFVLGE